MTLVGNAHTKLKPQPGYPRWNRNKDGEEYQFLYHVVNASAYSYVPPVGKQIPSPISGNDPLEIERVDIVEDGSGAPGVATLLLAYTPGNVGRWSLLRPGQYTLETDHKVTEKPIEQHPSWLDGTWTAEQKRVIKEQKGYKVFRLGQIEHRYTKCYTRAEFAYSEANIKADVNTLCTPTGVVTPTANKWMKVGRRLSYREKTVEVTDTWAYDEDEWEGSVDYRQDPL